jgi:hypothetical protein
MRAAAEDHTVPPGHIQPRSFAVWYAVWASCVLFVLGEVIRYVVHGGGPVCMDL